MRFIAILILAAALLARPALAGSGLTGSDPHAVHYYLSLGDSLAAGEQLPSDQNFGDQGYADQLYALKQPRIRTLKLVKLGCGGETTASMIDAQPQGLYEGRGNRYFCDFPHGSQLAEAVSFLRAHRGFVAFVTIDIGSNDLIGGGVPQIQANLPVILADLRAAAGPAVPIVGMNYYDPLLPLVWFRSFDLGALGAEANSLDPINDVLERDYATAGDPVADVESAFSTFDTTVQPNGVPLDVERICQWTWICAAGNLHPNATGYEVIAQAFEEALP
jgi:lysophospholipase L1-like esterase